jgi:hypothetical protein
MIALISLALCVAGFAGLCLSLTRHQRDLLGRDLPRGDTLALRGGGYGALVLALVAQAVTRGPAYGVMVWAGLLTLAAVLVVAGLALRAGRQAGGR